MGFRQEQNFQDQGAGMGRGEGALNKKGGKGPLLSNSEELVGRRKRPVPGAIRGKTTGHLRTSIKGKTVTVGFYPGGSVDLQHSGRGNGQEGGEGLRKKKKKKKKKMTQRQQIRAVGSVEKGIL